MPLQLAHIGEELIAEIFSEISRQGRLADIRCAFTGRIFADGVSGGGLVGHLDFLSDRASLCVQTDQGDYDCDGAQTIDVLCAGGQNGIAIEAKLGETLIQPEQFRKRFCVPCEVPRHQDRRLPGSMIAVPERSFDGTVPKCSRLACSVGGQSYTVSEAWWLVVRRSVLEPWKKRQEVPVSRQFARVVEFESLAGLYGLDRFDELVRKVVGRDFGKRWKLVSTQEASR